jgi:Tol biopolymer transport system component
MQSMKPGSRTTLNRRGSVERTVLLVLIAAFAVFAAYVILRSPSPSASGRTAFVRLTTDGRSSMKIGMGWSPDGRHILFMKVFRGTKADEWNDRIQLWLMDSDGRNAKPICRTGWQCDWGWSPDSKKIVFISSPNSSDNSPGTLFLYDVHTEHSESLATGFSLTSADSQAGWGIAEWAKDSRAFVILKTRTNDTKSQGEAFLFNLDTGKGKQLTPNNYRTASMNAGSWSPDGSYFAMQSKKTSRDNYRVWICRRDGSNLHPITPASWQVYGDPKWSPSGNLIAFSTNHGRLPEEKRNDECDIYLIKPDGTGLRQLTHGSSANVNNRMDFGYAEWLRDGRYVSCISNKFDISGKQYSGITLIEVKSGKQIPVITNYPGSNTVVTGFEIKNTNIQTGSHIAFIAQKLTATRSWLRNIPHTEDVLYSYDLRTHKLLAIQNSVPKDGVQLYSSGFFWRPEWSPNDRKLLFVKAQITGKWMMKYQRPDLYIYKP